MAVSDQEIQAADSEIIASLHRAGWRPGRTYDEKPWVESLEAAGFEINDPARRIWREFGGLTIRNSSSRVNPSSLFVEPEDACIDAANEAARLKSKYGENYSPLGMWSIQYRAYIGSGGRVLAIGPGGEWELGKSFIDALSFVISGEGPLQYLP